MAKQEDNRQRRPIPISGIDTATPDLTVDDGKCAELHNLRWAADGWRDIKPLAVSHDIRPAAGFEEWFSKMQIVYHHPAAGDNSYITACPDGNGGIDLCLAVVHDDGTFGPALLLNTIYCIQTYVGFNLHSAAPVASDILLHVNASTSDANDYKGYYTISKGNTHMNESGIDGTFHNMISRPTPEHDDIYLYRFGPSPASGDTIGPAYIARGLSPDIRISHFGNILIAIDPTSKRIVYYYLNNGVYSKYTIPTAPVITQKTNNEKTLPFNYGYFYFFADIPDYPLEDEYWFPIVPLYNAATDTYLLSQNFFEGYWHGEICYFAVLQMKDGSCVYPSALHYAVSELSNNFQEARQYTTESETKYRNVVSFNYQDGKAYEWECNHLFFIHSREANRTPIPSGDYIPNPNTSNFCIKPEIKITIPEDLDSHLIEGVAVFSTRIHPIYDTEKMKQLANEAKESNGVKTYFTRDARLLYTNNNLPEQPFYKIKDIPLRDFSDGEYCLELSFSLLNEIEQNQTYKATQGSHDVAYSGIKEYNGRAHLYGLGTKLFSGYTDDLIFNKSDTKVPTDVYTALEVGGKKYVVQATIDSGISKTSKILSYPDYRAVSIQLFGEGKQQLSAIMKAATANNFAYAQRFADEYETQTYNDKDVTCVYVKYPCFTLLQTNITPPIVTDWISEPNRIQVSSLNNIFNLPFANSYAIGTENNRILAVNSAAIEMSDAKFGEFPLYVFTEEGIFALQSGSGEVLYAAVVPINYDHIVNPATLAVNYNILYITSRGIHALSSEGTTLLSAALNNLDDIPPIDYLTSASMCFQHTHNEVIVWNDATDDDGAHLYDRAYVFSFGGRYWSTRDLMGHKINTDEFIARQNDTLILLFDPSGEEANYLYKKPTGVRLTTRPIKLGSVEFKRLETIIPRIYTNRQLDVRIGFEASVDLRTWLPLRTHADIHTARDIVFRRFPFSFRYLRITLEADVLGDNYFILSLFDLEYYLRFRHRMR